MKRLIALFAVLTLQSAVAQPNTGYALRAIPIAKNTYLVQGKSEDFSVANGANIANSAFIVTEVGVVVIDTGPSKRYGEQLRALIATHSALPIHKVFITHAHPDHMLGTQAFADVGVFALPATITDIKQNGSAYADNLYRLAQHWMTGTEVRPPTAPIQTRHTLNLGTHQIELIGLQGHSAADLVVFDHSTGVLFSGDLVFFERTPATPHANLAQWQAALRTLGELKFKRLVPGHGPVHDGARGIEQTARYLAWLDQTLRTSARAGRDMSELFDTPAPAIGPLAVFGNEFARSLAHLYPRYEQEALR